MNSFVSKAISLSILDGDFFDFSSSINYLLNAGLKSIHFDVMDGLFVPNISFGHQLIKSFCKHLDDNFDTSVHLMIKDAFKKTDSFLNSGVKRVVYHFEDTSTINKFKSVIEKHNKENVGLGLAINPKTDIKQIPVSLFKNLSEVVVMTVQPGLGGQKLISSCLSKVYDLALLKESKDFNFSVTVDGGVNDETIESASRHKIDQFIIGSYIWRNLSNAKLILENFQSIITKNQQSIS